MKDSIKVWNNKLQDYERYTLYSIYHGSAFDYLHGKSKSKQKERAKTTAKFLRSQGNKARVITETNSVGDYTYGVYVN